MPALLYLLQNNLQYVAVGYLDAASYTVSYQTKTIWSGILSMVLLNRTLGLNKWLGIVGLCAGVATVQIATMGDDARGASGGGGGGGGESDLPGGRRQSRIGAGGVSGKAVRRLRVERVRVCAGSHVQ